MRLYVGKYARCRYLADRSDGLAYGTMLCPSVCLSSVCNVCIVAKCYVLSKSCLKKQIWLPNCYPLVPIWTHCYPQFPQMGVLTAPPNTCVANCGQTAMSQLAAWLLLTAYRNLPTPNQMVPLVTLYGRLFSPNMGPYPQNMHGTLWSTDRQMTDGQNIVP